MEQKTFFIDTVIRNEKIRFLAMVSECEEKLTAYPRGKLVIRESKGHRYCYFRYRDGQKIVTKYAGTEKKLEELQQIVAERDLLLEKLKTLKAELRRIEKLEAVK